MSCLRGCWEPNPGPLQEQISSNKKVSKACPVAAEMASIAAFTVVSDNPVSWERRMKCQILGSDTK